MAEQAEAKLDIIKKLTQATQRIGEVHAALGVRSSLAGETETAVTVQGSQPLPPIPSLASGVKPGSAGK